MNKERLHIVLNKDIIDQLNLASGQELEAELYADKLVLQREEEPERRTLSSWVLIIATVLLSVIFFAIVLCKIGTRFYWLAITQLSPF